MPDLLPLRKNRSSPLCPKLRIMPYSVYRHVSRYNLLPPNDQAQPRRVSGVGWSGGLGGSSALQAPRFAVYHLAPVYHARLPQSLSHTSNLTSVIVSEIPKIHHYLLEQTLESHSGEDTCAIDPTKSNWHRPSETAKMPSTIPQSPSKQPYYGGTERSPLCACGCTWSLPLSFLDSLRRDTV